MPSTPFGTSWNGFWGLLVVVAGWCSPVMAQFSLPGQDPVQQTGNTLVKTAAELDGSAIIPGETVLLGVRYTIHPKWHIYWRNAGESGAPTELNITAPEGFTTGAIRWPRPDVFTSMGDTCFGYAGETMLFIPITAPNTITGEQVTIKITTEWLVCSDVCLFGKKEFSLSVPVARSGEQVTFKREDTRSFFSRMLAEVPSPLAKMPGAQASVADTPEGPVLQIRGPARRGAKVEFLPDHTPGVRYSGKAPFQAKVDGAGFLVEVPLVIAPDDALGKPLRAAGILLIGEGRKSPALEVDISISTGESEIEGP